MSSWLWIASTGLALAIPLQGAVPGPQPVCVRLDNAVESSLKMMAQSLAEVATDDSVPRATLAALRANTHLLAAQSNLLLMRENGCPARKDSIDEERYRAAATRCAKSLLGQRLEDRLRELPLSALPAACDMNIWKPWE